MVLKSDWPTANVARARPRLAVMSSIARYARVKAAECERYAATARDPETRQQYIQLARDWWEVARQGDRLRAKRSRSNIIIGEELRAYYHACTTEEPPPRLLVLLKKLDEETEPSAEQVG